MPPYIVPRHLPQRSSDVNRYSPPSAFRRRSSLPFRQQPLHAVERRRVDDGFVVVLDDEPIGGVGPAAGEVGRYVAVANRVILSLRLRVPRGSDRNRRDWSDSPTPSCRSTANRRESDTIGVQRNAMARTENPAR